MDKPPGGPPPGKAAAKREDYIAALVHLLEEIDFDKAQKAAVALGDSADASAIKALAVTIKGSAALRAAAAAALMKVSAKNDAAATELAIALLKEKRPEEVEVLAERDRRRSPRILLEIPVVVRWKDEKGESHTEPTTTMIVNAYGALMILKSPVAVGMELEVNNVTTLATAKARVIWLGDPRPDGGQQVGIELGNPDPDFWVGKTS